ncbi:MAG: adenylyltransferase/cytidyltransferase family protein, partial [Nitrosotalea sp.]
MDAFDKEIITAFFVASLSGDTATDIIRKKLVLNPEYIQEKIEHLVKNGFIEDNKKTLTELGRNSIRVVLAGGVFDIIHPGHIHTLKAAKALGNVLVVVIATDNTAQKMKKRLPLHNMELRKDLVRSLSMVDYAIVGYEGDIFKSVEIIKPNIIALGYDQ